MGRGVESAVSLCPDMELVALFTRRDPASVKSQSGVPVYSMNDAPDFKDKMDVMIL